MATVEKVTAQQAAEAFQALASGMPIVEPTQEAEPSPPQVAEPVQEVVEPVAEEEVQEAAPAVESDDVTSLKKRLEETEAREKEREVRFDSRMKALQSRNVESERILRDRYLRKSTATDKALRVLKAAKTDAGVDPSEADRVIAELEATMNPASATYAPPEPQLAVGTEEQALILNRFLNEQGMDLTEADNFGKWVRSEAATVLTTSEQNVARESLDGFLRIAHSRWQSGLREATKQQVVSDAVAAVKSVQRTQKQAARAAEVPSGAPKKQPAKSSDEVDVKKLTNMDISTLLRQTVEQYR